MCTSPKKRHLRFLINHLSHPAQNSDYHVPVPAMATDKVIVWFKQVFIMKSRVTFNRGVKRTRLKMHWYGSTLKKPPWLNVKCEGKI